MSVSEREFVGYRLVREVGRGGMAVVYLAHQVSLGREVALKELSGLNTTSDEMVQRFLRESRLAGSLNHPNIVTLHEFFEYSGIPYISMEYLERGSLRPHVGRLSFAQFAGVMEGVLAGLAHAAQRGIVHRDLKPENLLVNEEGRIKIADFGIAKATVTSGAAPSLTREGIAIGTPSYMAPEQAIASDEIGPWTDLYSVGVMAYEHVVGQPPFGDGPPPVILYRHVHEPAIPAVRVNDQVDPAVSEWIARLLSKNPHHRPASPSETWEMLEEIVVRLAGPLWRREARLSTEVGMRESPRALTPAPFEDRRPRTPAPVVHPTGVSTETPVSDYVTFGPKGDLSVAPPDLTPTAPPSPAEPRVADGEPPPPPRTPPDATLPPSSAGPTPIAFGASPLGPLDPPKTSTPLCGDEPAAEPRAAHEAGHTSGSSAQHGARAADPESAQGVLPGTGGRRRIGVAVGAIVFLAIIAGLTVALAGNGGSPQAQIPAASANITMGELPRFALKPSELPSGYTQTEAKSLSVNSIRGTTTTRQQAAIFRQLAADGLEGSSATEYLKSAGSSNNRPGSAALAFGNPGGAAKALPILRQLMINGTFVPVGVSGTVTAIPVSGLGDQTLPGLRLDIGSGYAVYGYLWRDRNVDVLVVASDVLGDMSGPSILMIAKQIDFRATGAHGTGSATAVPATTGSSTTSPPASQVINGHWQNTVGPLTLTITQVKRQGSIVTIAMTAESSSSITIAPFINNFQATDENGHTFTETSKYDYSPLSLAQGTPIDATVQLTGLPHQHLSLTIFFAHIFSPNPTQLPALSNGLRVQGVPVPP